MKDLNIRPETIKIVEENIGSKILGIACNNILSDISAQAREIKEKMNKWDYIKLKSFCTPKENINQIKRQHIKWRNIFSDTSDKGLISKTNKELIKLKLKKNNKLNLKIGKRLNRHFSKEDIQMANRHMKRCQCH